MLTKQEKEQLRGTIFRQLDGIATATTAYTLHEKGVLDYILEHKKVTLNELATNFKANEGYLNVDPIYGKNRDNYKVKIKNTANVQVSCPKCNIQLVAKDTFCQKCKSSIFCVSSAFVGI